MPANMSLSMKSTSSLPPPSCWAEGITQYNSSDPTDPPNYANATLGCSIDALRVDSVYSQCVMNLNNAAVFRLFRLRKGGMCTTDAGTTLAPQLFLTGFMSASFVRGRRGTLEGSRSFWTSPYSYIGRGPTFAGGVAVSTCNDSLPLPLVQN
jgi:hypothetical protein